jgi:hypothetical protein
MKPTLAEQNKRLVLSAFDTLFNRRDYDAVRGSARPLHWRMPVEALSAVHSLSAEAARERLASYVGPLDFALFQKLDHGAIVTALVGRPCKATTYVLQRLPRG